MIIQCRCEGMPSLRADVGSLADVRREIRSYVVACSEGGAHLGEQMGVATLTVGRRYVARVSPNGRVWATDDIEVTTDAQLEALGHVADLYNILGD